MYEDILMNGLTKIKLNSKFQKHSRGPIPSRGRRLYGCRPTQFIQKEPEWLLSGYLGDAGNSQDELNEAHGCRDQEFLVAQDRKLIDEGAGHRFKHSELWDTGHHVSGLTTKAIRGSTEQQHAHIFDACFTSQVTTPNMIDKYLGHLPEQLVWASISERGTGWSSTFIDFSKASSFAAKFLMINFG